ncbi:hypothetical protein KI688_008715 [Linnemannia hyalina]|uniref:Eisosome component PIL1-domain-containing protein n=1 Tax=Linnemannia hyalina TaxID=64524 RepID=A0A9P8BWQ7_9FUNG|nr:hypothetical protein KI688_008715 [Linnemannia hyalina]
MQSIGHDLRRGLNNFSSGNYKHINKWLAELKNIDSSLKTLDKEISTSAKLISAWGCNEGDDLTDICQRMTQLMENRKKKHDLTNQIAKQQKSSKENPIKMMELQNNLDRVSAELLEQELDLLQFKRQTIRDAFNCQFDSMIEYSEKMALIAGYGRQITNVIDCGPQPAERTSLYCGAEYTAAAINQVKIAVTSWQAQPVGNPIRPHIAPAEEELALSAAAIAYNNRTPPMNGHRQSNGQGFVNGAPESPGNWEEVRMINLGASQISLDESHGAAEQDHWKKEILGSGGQEEQYYPPTDPTPEASPYITSLQINQLQEQQRHLQMEQQRVYQNNQSMYSPSPSPSPTNQQSYHHTAASVAASLRKPSIDNYGNGGMAGGMAGAPGAGISNGRPFTPTMLRRNETSEFGSSGSASPGPSHNGGYGQNRQSSYEDNASPARGGQRWGFTDPRERSRMDNSDLYKTEITTSSRYSKTPVIMDEK